MRIFGFEITRSKPDQSIDQMIWNRHGIGPRRLGDLTPDELRKELAIVSFLSRTGKCYYTNPLDAKRQLHERAIEGASRYERMPALEYANLFI